MGSLSLKLRKLKGPLRRLIRWYLAPSGLLLAAALLVTVAALAFRQPWLGLGAVALMGIFLPYRLSRQQGVAEDRLMAEVARLQSEADLSALVRSWGPQIESISTTQTDFTKMRLLVAGRLSALDARVDEISDRDHGAEIARSLPDQLAELQAEIVELRKRIDATIPATG